MRARRAVLAVAALCLAAAATAVVARQADAAEVKPGAVVKSNVDRTLGRVERIETTPDGRRVAVVVSYDQPPLKRAVPLERFVSSEGGAARVDFGRDAFDRMPAAR
jgi:hypothetical protein